MGLLLLCLGNLAVTLLAAAAVVALAGRWRRRWLAVGFSLLVVVGFLATYAGLAALAGTLWKSAGIGSTLFCLLMALAVFFAGGSVWLTVAGLRGGEAGRRRAADWPLARLAALLAVAIVLHLTTWWGLELAAEQRTTALRAESALLILAAAPPPVPDGDNAAFLYSQAARTIAITADAKRRLAVTAVAVCRFRAARGRLPDTLAELSPQFLAILPCDPFDGRPLRMKKTGENLVVYSIGEDGKDDGGIPWDFQKQAGDITFTIKVIPQ
jgi:hypothetical protein